MSPSLEGRVCLVTGSTRGIGWAMAETFAKAGALVVVHGREAGEALDARVAQLETLTGKASIGVAADLRGPAAVQSIFRTVFGRFRRLDVLVNNAGILRDALLGMISVEMAQETLAINTLAPLIATQEAARLMKRSGGGSIINVSSIIGRVGNEGQTAYAASKAAVIGLTLAAAKELAPNGIRVNAIAPGYIDTDMVRALSPQMHAARIASIKMGRVGTAQDVANVALFLASDLSGYVTGQVLGVDGGMLI